MLLKAAYDGLRTNQIASHFASCSASGQHATQFNSLLEALSSLGFCNSPNAFSGALGSSLGRRGLGEQIGLQTLLHTVLCGGGDEPGVNTVKARKTPAVNALTWAQLWHAARARVPPKPVPALPTWRYRVPVSGGTLPASWLLFSWFCFLSL